MSVADQGPAAAGLSPAKRRLLEQRLRGASAGATTGEHGAGAAGVDGAGTIPRRAGSGPSPLSTAQRRIWLAERLAPGSPAYTEAIVLRLEGPLGVAALAAALAEVVRRHEVLRSVHLAAGSRPPEVPGYASPAGPPSAGESPEVLQLALDFSGLQLPVVDLSGLAAAGEAAERLAEEGARRPLQLAVAPLRVMLLRLGPCESWLLLDLHHAVFDAWTFENLFRELAFFYGAAERLAAREGQPGGWRTEAFPAGLPPEPALQYADFALWERERLAAGALAGQLEFWRRRLAGLAPSLDLGADRDRTAVSDLSGGRHPVRLAPELALALRALAGRNGVTLFSLLLAGVAALLQWRSGETDLAVGTVAAGRPRPELEPLLGFFANNLTLRLAVDPARGLEELLGEAQKRLAEALDHQEAPFEWLVAELRPEREPGAHPFFQVLLLVQPSPFRPRPFAGLVATPRELASGTAKFDLAIHLYVAEGRAGPEELPVRDEQGIAGFIEYSARLFDPPTVARLAGNLEALLASAVAQPRCPLAELSGLGEGERHQLLREWSETAGPSSGAEECLHWLVEERARLEPDALAVVGRDAAESLSYRELDERAACLAGRLREVGIAPEDRVGLLFGRSIAMVMAQLAVFKAGGACVPLDPVYPRRRLEAVARDAGLSALVCEEPCGELLAGLAAGLPVLHLSVDEAEGEESSADALGGGCLGAPEGGWSGAPKGACSGAPEGACLGAPKGACLGAPKGACLGAPKGACTGAPLPRNLAFVLYTSGSTGVPKGVALEHRGLAALVRWSGQVFSRRDLARVLAATSWSFDMSLFEIYAPLAAGGTVRLVADALAAGEAPEVTLVNTVPSAAAEVVRAGRFPPSVATVNLGGEPLAQDLVEDLYRRCPAVSRVFDLYGPTECSIYSTCALRRPGDRPGIGRPLPGVRVHLLDAWMRAVPAGVVGELAVAGPGLARGYLGRPELTAERFLPDPTPGEPGGRIYRTGDLARRRPDGSLELLGRRDEQIKLRGFRIELGEIEAVLRRHPAVRGAAALVARGSDGEPRLAACVAAGTSPEAPRPGHERPRLEEELLTLLAETLPPPMVPARIQLLDELPRLPNGKLDRRSLLELSGAGLPAAGEVPAATSGGPPRSLMEETLGVLWGEVLGGEPPGREAHFFALGGHSLLALRLLSRLQAAVGMELPLGSVFRHPTLAALAAEAERQLAAESAGQAGQLVLPPLLAAPPEAQDADAPLSPAQQRLWFLHLLAPESAGYHIAALARLSGRLDATALAVAVWTLRARHPALRTIFAALPGGSVQRVAPPPPLPVPLPELDLSALPHPRREAGRLAPAFASLPFDLEREPPLRVLWLRLSGEESLLVLALHHIACDEWSLEVLVGELAAAYAAACRGTPPRLPPLPFTYADFARWQREIEASAAAYSQLVYWTRQLEGLLPTLDLPADRPRPRALSYRGGVARRPLPDPLAARLAGFARRQDATLYLAALAAFKALLHRLTGETDLLVASPVSCRSRAGLEGLVGLCLNLVVLRTRIGAGAGFGELLDAVRRVGLEAYSHRDVAFERVVERLAPERSLARSPLTEVFFVLADAFAEQRLPELLISTTGVHGGGAKVDLTLVAVRRGGALVLEAEYSSDLFDAVTMERLLGHFEALLESLLAEPWAPLASRHLLGPAERHQLGVEWRDRPGLVMEEAGARVRGAGLHELFFAQAARRPEAEAVVCDGERLSYAGLAREARRLAVRLRRLGVGPESRVGLFVERSLQTVVGITGILAAGGAYVPLDPSYPADWIAYVLEDAGLALVVTGRDLAGRLPPRAGLRVLFLEGGEDEDEVRAAAGPAPAAGSWSEHLAYLMYTSGSTGRPKGVMISHGNVTRLFAATAALAFGEADVWTLFHSFAFDFSVWELWGALLHGGRLVVVPYWVARDPARFRELLAAERVTVLSQTPSAFRHLAQADEDALAAGEAPATGGHLPEPVNGLGLRLVIFGGERLEPADLRAWVARHPLGRPCLVNMYGITETTVHVTLHQLSPADLDGSRRGSIGRPLADLSVLLLDAHGDLAPLGVAGEICVAGAGLARGYLGRAELTADRFRPDPRPASAPPEEGGAGGRLYLSGDLGRLRPSGDIEHLGRIDHQVKVRGFRIELGEIETVLGGHPGVREAVVVVAARTSAARARLVCYFVPAGAEEPPAAELREWLARRLPEHMVPAAFVAVEAVPRTPSGKLDRRYLPEPERAHISDPGTATEPPRSAVERLLSRIWAEILQLPDVGIRDGFFALGGDSILGIQVVYRCRAAGLDLSLRQLFEHQTIAELGAALEEAGAACPPAPGGSAQRMLGPEEAGGSDAPLCPAQLWMLAQQPADPHHWNQSLLLRLPRHISPALLARGLAALTAHHEALRLRFRPAVPTVPPGPAATGAGRVWRQAVAPPEGEPAPVWLDLSGLPAARRQAAYAAAADALQASLDLARGPLARPAVFDLDPGEPHRLLFIAHHLVVDGVSWRIVIEDLAAALAQLAGQAHPAPVLLPPVATPFLAWTREVHARARAGGFDEAAAGWLPWALLAAPPLPREVSAGADRNRVGTAGVQRIELDRQASAPLLRDPAASRAAGSRRVEAILLSAFARAIARWSGERRLRLDLERHGRDWPGMDLSRTVGWFTALFPVVLELPPEASPTGDLAAVEEQLGRVPGGGESWGVLRHLCAAEGRAVAAVAAAPAAEIRFNYLGQFQRRAAVAGGIELSGGEAAGAQRSPRQRRGYLLEVDAHALDGALRLELTWSRALHRRETIEALAEGIAGELRKLSGELGKGAALRGYRLSPLQCSMLAHSLDAPDSEALRVRYTATLGGALDEGLWLQSWRELLARHPVLRSSFVWEGPDGPRQLVAEQVALPVVSWDWQGLSQREQEARLDKLKDEELLRPFDLARPPLLRLHLIRTGAERHELVVTYHHLLLDGWSLRLVRHDLLTCYAALRRGLPLAPWTGKPFQDYIAWLENRGVRGTLPAGLPPAAAAAAGGDHGERFAEQGVLLSEDATAVLDAFVRAHQLTLNTLVQGAWSLLLSLAGGGSEVVFGVALSGRPAELPGADAMVGVLLEVLPLSVRIPRQDRVVPWLRELQARASELQHAGAAARHPGVDPCRLGSTLFYQSMPRYTRQARAGDELEIVNEWMLDRWPTPVTAVVEPITELWLEVSYQRSLLDDATMVRALDLWHRLMDTLATRPELALADLLAGPAIAAAARNVALPTSSQR